VGAHGVHGTDPLAGALAQAHHLLPDQGPIGVFVHHNTLHAWQHLPFHEAVQRGAVRVGARPYPELDTFRGWHADGRIEDTDVDAALNGALGASDGSVGPLGVPARTLVRRLLTHAHDEADEAGLRYLVSARPAGLPDAATITAASERLRRTPRTPRATSVPSRHRDALVRLGASDTDVIVHAELVRLSSAFLDEGQAQRAMPGREDGFLRAAARVLVNAGSPRGCEGAERDAAAVLRDETAPEDVVHACLAALGVPEDAAEEWLLSTALALPGWTGMHARLERHPDERTAPGRASLVEVLAVRLLLERWAVTRAAADAGLPVAWPALLALLPRTEPPRPTVDAVLLAELSESAGLDAAAVLTLGDGDLAALWDLVDAWPSVRRRQVWLEAYEGRYRRQVLDAVHTHRAWATRAPEAVRAQAQFVFCIDEREESIRRALEEQDPLHETFGVAGFFGFAIDYRGLDDHAAAAYCPVVVTPAHEVHEAPIDAEATRHAARTAWRDRLHGIERSLARLSRTLLGGAGLALAAGPIAGALAASRVLAPRASLAARQDFDQRMAPRPQTRLSALRAAGPGTVAASGKPVGFGLDEAADRVTGTLRNIGLVACERFAPVVVLLGHGSTSLNNPHESAHDCGACGGRLGGANARIFADLANRPDVRDAVRARGVDIPAGTWFVGGLHDTADDLVTLYDLDLVPAAHADAVGRARVALELARRESARERCRRFEDAPLGIGPDAALHHVQARASHLAQPRPEYGHCTNAIAVVGRRARTRGLFLDRRPFLISYDPTVDSDDAVLERILAAVGPVGAGISLEYYFSSTDNDGFGCGTKLPHNVTGLIGVMNGHQGDLRTGLPLQMVELHEPMRLLLIVEATPEALLGVAGRQAGVAELVVNRWVQLVSLHPDTGALAVFGEGGFVPYVPAPVSLPEVSRSVEWYGTHRRHLPPAHVRAGLVTGA
jgi:uncharacterized protein YbcC (UPF0753/DUF2309 family)